MKLDNAFVFVINATLDDMRMDCCDEDRVHVWLCAPRWETRRAVLTGGDALFRAFLLHEGSTTEHLDRYFETYHEGPVLTGFRQLVKALTGQPFQVDIDIPDGEVEGGERIEITNIRIPPPIAEVTHTWRGGRIG